MRAPFIFLFVILLSAIAVDIYIYVQSKRRCHSPIWSRIHMVTAVLLAVMMIIEIILPARAGSHAILKTKMWVLFAYMSVYLPKYIVVFIDLLASLPRLWHKERIKWLTKGGIAIGVTFFCAMWWGALINRFRIQIKEVTIDIAELPASFDGFKIAQFSDLHTGTFGSDTTFVAKLVDKINSLHPDAVMFTGDIVNRESSEAVPFATTLARLKAPMGRFAILGNHDYGDYMNWPSDSMKHINMQALYDFYSGTGMRLLLNETEWLHRGNDSIAVVGVENIGDPPFKTYGSLQDAYPTPSDDNVKILLTHNPQHWVDSIAGKPGMNFALSLSGHTHATQMELAGISPATLRYKTWGGLYSDDTEKQYLYVNIGCGTVGVPMRIGAPPEITLITLRRSSQK